MGSKNLAAFTFTIKRNETIVKKHILFLAKWIEIFKQIAKIEDKTEKVSLTFKKV